MTERETQSRIYKGRFGRSIELHENHLVLRRRGARRDIPLDVITGIEFSPASTFQEGHLRLELAYEPPAAVPGPNRVQFLGKQSSAFEKLADVLRERIAANQVGGVDATAVPFQRTFKGDPPTSGATFEGITLKDGHIVSPNGGGPVAGARANIDTGGALSRRITATRLVMTGPVALAWRKKKDDRELYLSIEGHGWAVVVPVSPAKTIAARRFAANINALASRLAVPKETTAATSPVIEPATLPDQIERLAELRDAGSLTPDEFRESKAALLKRP